VLADFRKLNICWDDRESPELVYMDQWVEILLVQNDVLGLKLPRLQSRSVLESTRQLGAYCSLLSDAEQQVLLAQSTALEEKSGSKQCQDELPTTPPTTPPIAPPTTPPIAPPTMPPSKRFKHSAEDFNNGPQSSAKEPDENSIEYWNKMREKLGLRPLKE